LSPPVQDRVEQTGTEFQKVSSPQHERKSPTNEGLQKNTIIFTVNVVIFFQSEREKCRVQIQYEQIIPPATTNI